jgi:hypothetical protein
MGVKKEFIFSPTNLQMHPEWGTACVMRVLFTGNMENIIA